MGKKNRWTPEEFRAYRAEREESIRKLRERAERIRIELVTKRRARPA
jgi:hypothetical protein